MEWSVKLQRYHPNVLVQVKFQIKSVLGTVKVYRLANWTTGRHLVIIHDYFVITDNRHDLEGMSQVYFWNPMPYSVFRMETGTWNICLHTDLYEGIILFL